IGFFQTDPSWKPSPETGQRVVMLPLSVAEPFVLVWASSGRAGGADHTSRLRLRFARYSLFNSALSCMKGRACGTEEPLPQCSCLIYSVRTCAPRPMRVQTENLNSGCFAL